MELSTVYEVPVRALRASDSPRTSGVCPDHVRTLVESEAALPPIIVHRPAMRVIDGMHRLHAARLRGQETIPVVFFDGDEEAAFLLGVSTNTRHGLPLSSGDRKAAAQRILRARPDLSDRAVAEASGISARIVAALRADGSARVVERAARVGRDGRSRPVDPAAARERVRELVEAHPEASLRFVAKRAGVSPTTVRTVRAGIEAGQGALARTRRRPSAPGGDAGPVPAPVAELGEPAGADPHPPSAEPAEAADGSAAALLGVLTKDPSLRFSESGRQVIALLSHNALLGMRRHQVLQSIPPHAAAMVASLSRECAKLWSDLADELEDR